LKLTLAFVEACGAEVEGWQEYWAQIKRATDPAAPPAERSVLPPWRAGMDEVALASPTEQLDVIEAFEAVKPVEAAGGTCCRRPALAAALLLCLALAVMVVLAVRGLHHSAGRRSTAVIMPVSSGTDVHRELEFHKGGAPSLADPHEVAGVGPRTTPTSRCRTAGTGNGFASAIFRRFDRHGGRIV
jgi:hypothetical protein